MSLRNHNTEKWLKLYREKQPLDSGFDYLTPDEDKRLEEINDEMGDLFCAGLNNSTISRCIETGVV